MATEHQIVARINTVLTQPGGQFDSKKFQKGRFSGIAELIPKEDGDNVETVPAIIANNEDATNLGIDDTNTFELYHRHTGSTVEETEPDFGDRMLRKQTANMIMIVIGDRDKLKTNKEEITNGILLGMPLELGRQFLIDQKLNSAQIIPGTFNYNRDEVWAAEYNTEIKLNPNQFMFSMTYDIETIAGAGCIELCE